MAKGGAPWVGANLGLGRNRVAKHTTDGPFRKTSWAYFEIEARMQ